MTMEHGAGRSPELGESRGAGHVPPRTGTAAGAPGAARFGAGGRGLIGAAVRTLLFDIWTEEFLTRHPGGTVVDLGAAPGTRFERLDNGTAHWYEFGHSAPEPDLRSAPGGSVAARGRRHRMAMDPADPVWTGTWTEAVRASPGPYFLIAEAVPPHWGAEQIRQVFRTAAARLPGAHFAVETAAPGTPDLHDLRETHDAPRPAGGPTGWHCTDPAEPESWYDGIRLTQSCTLARLPAAVSARIPMPQRGMLRAMATVMRRQVQSYRFNRYLLGG
ncbi:hypothetical protein [Streptomyces sp. CAU 1734]|uniref:hypothetical protein n=1 Tax=Streptomyces sp. CAU 1734 TaxID=3140360 RepID=UPI00325FEC38